MWGPQGCAQERQLPEAVLAGSSRGAVTDLFAFRGLLGGRGGGTGAAPGPAGFTGCPGSTS